MSGILRRYNLLLIILLVLGGFLRFYNLNWGAPYYFHPDERNIVSSVTQLAFPENMNPHFFAYGSLPIYAIYTTGLIKNITSYCTVPFDRCLPTDMTSLYFWDTETWHKINTVSFSDAAIISRLFSAVFSTLLIFLLYQIGIKIKSKHTAIITAFFAVFSTGFLQFAHFGTFEMWQTFLSVILLLISIRMLKGYTSKHIMFAGIITGFLVAVKITNLVLLPLPLLAITASFSSNLQKSKTGNTILGFIACITQLIAVISIAAFVFLITNPYIILDFHSSKNTLQYESNVALGTTHVFYTQEFFNTIPVFFQFTKVYPFLLNPLLTLLFIPSFVYVIFIAIKTRNKNYMLLAITYLLLFLSQAFLFVKWTRYMVPTLPFMYLIIAITIDTWLNKINKSEILNPKSEINSNDKNSNFLNTYRFGHLILKNSVLFRISIFDVRIFLLTTVSAICILFSFSYFKTVLMQPDTRIAAKEWADLHIQKNEYITSEAYDLGIIAFNSSFSHISLCDFYNLENNTLPCNNKSLQQNLLQSRYIILPSERILKTRITDSKRFSKGSMFYTSILHEKLGFNLIYKTPCDIFCRVIYLNNPLFSFEQTANVFDRPTVYIFKKISNY